MARRTQSRRGVLLLIVLSLLVLFVLVGMSFIVSASAFKDSADVGAKSGITGMDGVQIANSAVNQILHGNKSPLSKVRGHSLLEDLYGRDYFIGRVTPNPGNGTPYNTTTANQLQVVDFAFVRWGNVPPDLLRDDYFGGCVMTFITGDATGESVRISRYINNTGGVRRIEFMGVLETGANGVAATPFKVGDMFVVNGRPFNGTGAGFSTPAMTPMGGVAGKLNNAMQLKPSSGQGPYMVPVALMPNYSTYQFEDMDGTPQRDHAGLEEITYGGQDESYDAVDYQNMALAKVPTRINAITQLGLTESDPGRAAFFSNTGGVIPSFHRPYLLSYIARNYPGVLQDKKLRRPFLFRPDTANHPSFTGSNPTFNQDVFRIGADGTFFYDPDEGDGIPDGWSLGPWDVDNDGDGVPDSIWMDFGHDPITGNDGRLYKPLVAALIIDMDGKININTAGSLQQAITLLDNDNLAEVGMHAVGPVAGNGTRQISSNLMGLGFGSADVDPSTLYNNVPNYQQILFGRYQGVNESLQTDNSSGTMVVTSNAVPGGLTIGNVDEDFTLFRDYKIPGNVLVPDQYLRADQVGNATMPGLQTSVATGYGSLPDLSGRSIPFIGPNGGMSWAYMGPVTGMNDGIDDPYEMDPLHHNSRDGAYTIEDLDYLLRFEDSRTQGRLREIDDTTLGLSPFGVYMADGGDSTRRLFTTHSVHIPAIPSLNPGKWRHGNEFPGSFGTVRGEGLRRSVREMFAGKIFRVLQAQNPGMDKATLEQQAFVLAGNLVPPQMAAGELLDINQALRGTIEQKREFATHLFHLMMLLSDDEMVMPITDHTDRVGGTLSFDEQRELHVRRIAQWAINVVDFGDADSVNTYFEYDVNPFDAVLIKSLVAPTGKGTAFGPPDAAARRIWGCEHPEMVLSETLATHDRRVEDSSLGGPREENGSIRDPDLDQQQNPQATTFIELLCMRGMSQVNGGSRPPRIPTEKGPEDLYNAGEIQNSYWPTLNLGAVDRFGNPVWQLAISERQLDSDLDVRNPNPLKLRETNPEETSFDPLDFNLLPTQNPQMRITRRVWFHRPRGPVPPDVFANQSHKYLLNDPMAAAKLTAIDNLATQAVAPVVEPGMYVVLGPEAISNIGLEKSGTASSANQQRIDLLNMDHRSVGGGQLRSLPQSRVLSIVAQSSPSGRQTGLNISAPIDGYSAAPTDRPKDNRESATNAEDAPLWYATGVADDENMQLATGVREGFRTVFLQRLADPTRPLNENLNDRFYNPYISIDWMPIDLTVFNSLDEESNSWDQNLGPFDPQDPPTAPAGVDPIENFMALDFDGGVPNPGYFASREKSGTLFGTAGNRGPIVGQNLNIWSSRSDWGQARPLPAGAGNSYTRSVVNLQHTLGWLNRSFDNVPPNVPLYERDAEGHFIPPGQPYSEAPNSRLAAGTQRTFPSLVWHNRPYANTHELMLVPACSPSRLSQEFTTSRTVENPANGIPTGAAQPLNVPVTRLQPQFMSTTYKGAFGHLLNFFNSTPGSIEESQPAQLTAASNHHRIFDFVTVPSRYRGTETWFNAATVAANPTMPRKLSKFREPGRVNINTASDPRVWRAILGSPNSRSYLEFENAMAGVTVGDVTNPGLSLVADTQLSRVPTGDYPSEYPYPYRSSVSGDLLPPLFANGSPRTPRQSVDSSLLRGSSLEKTDPAFARFNSPEPSFDSFGEKHQTRQTNAYFRFRDILKSSGSVTSQSNVYAVWLTVGFFEIEPNYQAVKQNDDGTFVYDVSKPYHVDDAHPDGYRFGVEMGSELGNVVRHRSFYIIDRSIPVAFEPGVNHNTDKAILLRRHLE